MTGAEPVADLVPVLRTDVVRRDFGDECVVWSPVAPEPVVLDPVATVMLDVVDGDASVEQLALDVHETVGVPLDAARRQVGRVVALFAQAGLLASPATTFTADQAIGLRDLFASMSTPCSENASRLGTVTLNLQLGDHRVRVACDSRRGARKLRTALADHLVEDAGDLPLAFALTAPTGLQRRHSLTDRAGLVLSEGRGLDAGLHALACHLTALLPPRPGTVRLRARAVVSERAAIVCLFPHLLFPAADERKLARAGLAVIDRLALDVEVATGRLVNPDVPWPLLAELVPGTAHEGTGLERTVTAVVEAAPPGSPPPTEAGVVAALAAQGLHGSTEALLDAAAGMVRGAELRSAPPEGSQFYERLGELAAARS